MPRRTHITVAERGPDGPTPRLVRVATIDEVRPITDEVRQWPRWQPEGLGGQYQSLMVLTNRDFPVIITQSTLRVQELIDGGEE